MTAPPEHGPVAQPKPKASGFDPAIVALAAILIVAAALRVYGLDWGLTDSLHLFSFHPDETTMVRLSTPELGGINLATGNFLPHYYDYGSLPFYLIHFAILMGTAYHLIGPVVSNGQLVPASLFSCYMAARLLSVVFGVGTVWAVHAIGRRLWNRSVALLAAAIVAIIPLHVQHSHFATVDVGATFWQMLSLVGSARLIGATRPASAARPNVRDYRDAAFAGLFAGLTAATKYSGILVLIPVAVAAIVRVRGKTMPVSRAAAAIAIAGFAALAAFVIACPGSVLETGNAATPGSFIYGIEYESNHVMHHGEIYFQQTGPGWIYMVTRNLDAGMGLPLLAVALAAIGFAIYRRRPADALLAGFALPYYLLTGAAQSRYARYDIPLLPILALWSARLVCEVPDLFGASAKTARTVVFAATALVLAFTFADTCVLIAPMTSPDTRERAAIWLNEHAPAPTPIAFAGLPWFWSPAINVLFSSEGPGAWKAHTPPSETARYVYNPSETLDPAILTAPNAPRFAVVSEYEYYDALRLKQPNALAYVDALRRLYNPPIVFADPHPIGGIDSIDGLPAQDLPTDMLYTRPTILVFTRRAPTNP
jgi:4-amino-4-deoxy-L-arabinose transferase-like glycosyltransferase